MPVPRPAEFASLVVQMVQQFSGQHLAQALPSQAARTDRPRHRESFDSKLRDELLNSEIFTALYKAQCRSRIDAATTTPSGPSRRWVTDRPRWKLSCRHPAGCPTLASVNSRADKAAGLELTNTVAGARHKMNYLLCRPCPIVDYGVTAVLYFYCITSSTAIFGGTWNDWPRVVTSLMVSFLRVSDQWSTGLCRMTDFVRLTVFDGDATRLSVKPQAVQIELLAMKPSQPAGCVTSKTVSYQPRQASSCCLFGNELVEKLSANTAPPWPVNFKTRFSVPTDAVWRTRLCGSVVPAKWRPGSFGRPKVLIGEW